MTEYAQNGTLRELIEFQPPEWTSTIKLINMYGIANAMLFLHKNGIIHRDLKPGNILLNEFMFPVVADFGLSKDTNIESSTIEAKGTPLFIAPEIWDDARYSFASDVYAYGFILYQIMTSNKPFKNLTPFKIMKKVCDGDRPDTDSIPEPYRSLIEACWSQTPSLRPTFKQIVERLRSDSDFLIETVNEKEFFDYVEYIDSCPKSFDQEPKFVFDNKTSKFRKVELKKNIIYPKSELKKLSPACQEAVNEAVDDVNQQYSVGVNLLKGNGGFPENVDLGVKYLMKAIEGGNIDAVKFYNKMLIVGKVIPEDLDLAKRNLTIFGYLDDPEITFLLAMIERKQENSPER